MSRMMRSSPTRAADWASARPLPTRVEAMPAWSPTSTPANTTPSTAVTTSISANVKPR